MDERRFPVHARAHRQALTALAVAVVALLVASPALAAPKTAKARAAFDAGLAAYKSSDYATASDAFSKSYALEADVETLFAWAQSERQAEHCDKAIELYEKLLAQKLPDANRELINTKLGECQEILAKQQPEPPPEPPVTNPTPTPAPVTQPTPPSDPPRGPEGKSRWKDPIGIALVGGGAIGLGVGIAMLVQSHGASNDSKAANNYADALSLRDKAESRGKIGVAATIAGTALLAGGVVRFVTHKPRSPEGPVITGWLGSGSAGIAAAGRF